MVDTASLLIGHNQRNTFGKYYWLISRSGLHRIVILNLENHFSGSGSILEFYNGFSIDIRYSDYTHSLRYKRLDLWIQLLVMVQQWINLDGI
jgi:hypothetical protein